MQIHLKTTLLDLDKFKLLTSIYKKKKENIIIAVPPMAMATTEGEYSPYAAKFLNEFGICCPIQHNRGADMNWVYNSVENKFELHYLGLNGSVANVIM